MATVTKFDLDATKGGLDGATTYVEGAVPKLLAPDATVTATGDFNGQTLVISGLLAEDQIGFASGVTVNNKNIKVGNKIIGTFSGGTDGSDFIVTFTSNATAAQVQTLLHNLTFLDASDNPVVSQTLSIKLAGTIHTEKVAITPVNDAPVLDLNGAAGAGTAGAISYAIGNPVTKIASLGTVFDANSANFSGGSLHVAFTENGTATDQLKIVTDAIVTLTGAGGTTIKVNGTSIGTWSGGSNGTDLVISFNNAATPAAVQTLIEHIGYANSSASPSTLTREVTFTVNDGDGTANSGSNIGLAIATISYNHAPTAVAFADATTTIAENADTSSHFKVADIVVTDDGLGTNALTLAGVDAAAFEIVGNSLYLKAGTALDFETKSSYSVAVKVDDPSVGSNPDATSPTFTLTVGNINEAPKLTTLSASGSADANIPLNITVEAVDAVGTLGQVKILGVPSVYTLTAGTELDAAGAWLVTVSDLPGLALAPIGTATAGEFTLQVVATSVDGASTATASTDLSVTVNPGANQHSGFVIDGYIAGATVFADANGNGALDPDEAYAITKADGSFILTGGSGPLVMSGGTDVSTGLPFEGVLSAPEGSTVVTPLTTLVLQLAPTMVGATPEEKLTAAQNAVAAAFGLDPDIDLQTFNPVPLALSGDSAATDVLSAAIQVQSMVTQISAAPGSTGDVFAAIANEITAANGGTVDLSQPGVVGDIAAATGIVDATTLAVVTDVVAAAIDSIQAATDVTELAQAGKVAQGEAADALAGTDFNNPDDVASLTQTYVTDLSIQIQQAQVGDVSGAQVGTLGDDILTGGSGVDAIGGLDGRDRIDGAGGNDLLYGDAGYDTLIGGAGDDILNGGSELDRALYTDATGPITVNLAAGSVSGAGVGTDTLVSIEQIRGSSSDDSYTATGYTGGSPIGSVPATFNEFEGMAGNDVITGNGDTALSYLNATAGVTVNFTSWVLGQGATGTATGDASVGTDSFTGVRIVRGSEFADHLNGSNNPAGTVEVFQGRGGDDIIDGGGGFDRVFYWFRTDDNVTGGLTINMAAGTVVGDASVGTDTLRSIESMRASNFDDTYIATGFSASSTNAGSLGTFNSFEGLGGDDTITGNSNTRIEYINATAAVTVDFTSWVAGQGATGTATGDTSVGHDTFTGVNAVIGSYFADTLSGSNNLIFTTETFQGGAGDDTINGRGGFDIAVYNSELGTTVGIEVTLATIVGDAFKVVGDASIGTDMLTNTESVRGTNFADTFNAAGYNGASADIPNGTTFSEFEGMGGDDTITGNGLTGLAGTRITYVSATGGVTVDVAAGTATGDASVGTDHFTGVLNVRGSPFDDTLSGNANNNILEGQGGNDVLDGRGGNDTLTGGVGADRFVYANNGGADAVTDFSHAQADKIDLTGVTGVTSLADVLAIATQNSVNTVIDFGSGDTLTLNNVTKTNLAANDFIFHL